MRKFIFGVFLGILLSCLMSSYADKISSPPPLAQDNPTIQHYFAEIYTNLHRLEVVTTNPDAGRAGKKGDMLLLQTGGSSYIEINTDGSKQWLGVLLSDTP